MNSRVAVCGTQSVWLMVCNSQSERGWNLNNIVCCQWHRGVFGHMNRISVHAYDKPSVYLTGRGEEVLFCFRIEGNQMYKDIHQSCNGHVHSPFAINCLPHNRRDLETDFPGRRGFFI